MTKELVPQCTIELLKHYCYCPRMNLKAFYYKGSLPASKSILNRLLLMASYAEPNTVKIEGDSTCDDVQLMKAGLLSLSQQEPVNCGFAGAVLRFLALKAARIPGRHLLYGHKRLFERPQQPLLDNLQKLGVRAMIKYASQPKLIIDSEGWKPSRGALVVDRSISSQFASGIVLNAWGLSFDLSLRFSNSTMSNKKCNHVLVFFVIPECFSRGSKVFFLSLKGED